MSQRPNAGKFVDSGYVEVEPHVLVAESAAVLKIRVRQCGATHGIVVVNLRVVPLSASVRGIQVDTLAPSEVVLRIQTMPAALVIGHLHAVVLGCSQIGCCDQMPDQRTSGHRVNKSVREWS